MLVLGVLLRFARTAWTEHIAPQLHRVEEAYLSKVTGPVSAWADRTVERLHPAPRMMETGPEAPAPVPVAVEVIEETRPVEEVLGDRVHVPYQEAHDRLMLSRNAA